MGDYMKKAYSIKIVVLIVLSIFLYSCSEDDSGTNPAEDTRITVNNDATALSTRIISKNETVLVDTLVNGAFKPNKLKDYELTLVAEVEPPSVDGQVLQATDIQIQGNRVYVSYNVAGGVFKGGVDIFVVTNPEVPILASNISFDDTDVNGIYVDGSYLYLASASELYNDTSPALLERISLVGGLLSTESARVDIPSFASTDVTVSGGNVYITSGAAGGYVSIIDKNSLEKVDSVAIEDARSVATDNQNVAVLAGTNARLYIFDSELSSLTSQYSLNGATIPFSKSTVELVGNKAVLGLGDGGMQIFCLESEEVVGSIEHPIVDGLDPSVTVTNAASVDKSLVFISNGEAGVYMAETDNDITSNKCDVGDLQLLGKLIIGDLESVNHVAFKGNVLFVAGGLGGLKIITVDKK